jgi:ferrous-iron efflux pump FieF
MKDIDLMKMTSRMSVIVALVLTALKLYAVYVTDSLSILSSLFDSCMDMLASVGNLFAITLAARPADQQYRFGYGKLEAVSALVQSMFVLMSVLFILWEAFQRAMNPVVINEIDLGLRVMVVSIVLTLMLIALQNYTVRKTGSLAIKADALHYRTDLAVNFAVIASLYLSKYIPLLDSLCCMGIGIYVIFSTREIVRESLWVLLDREIPKYDQQTIMEIIRQYPGVLGFHNFRSRSSGRKIFIETHVEMDPGMTLRQADVLAQGIRVEVERIYPNAEILVHQDPAGDDPTEVRFEF